MPTFYIFPALDLVVLCQSAVSSGRWDVWCIFEVFGELHNKIHTYLEPCTLCVVLLMEGKQQVLL